MLRSCLNLIGYLIQAMAQDTATGLRLRAAFARYADFGSVTAEHVNGILDALGDLAQEELAADGAVSCGQSANAFCYIFAQANMPETRCVNLVELARVVLDIRPRIIRITLGGGHTYVIEQTDSPADGKTAMGNIYQSNIAVLGNREVGVTLQSFLAEQGNPVRLSGHLADLAILAAPAMAPATKLPIYQRLFTTNAYFRLPRTHAVTTADIVKAGKSICFTEARYQDFSTADVAEQVRSIFLAAGDAVGTRHVGLIYKHGALPG
jgi:hypothetical protein